MGVDPLSPKNSNGAPTQNLQFSNNSIDKKSKMEQDNFILINSFEKQNQQVEPADFREDGFFDLPSAPISHFEEGGLSKNNNNFLNNKSMDPKAQNNRQNSNYAQNNQKQQQNEEENLNSNTLNFKPFIEINYAAVLDFEFLSRHFKQFKSANYQEKARILHEIMRRNTQSLFQFLQMFHNSLDASAADGLFTLLVQLIYNYSCHSEDSLSRVFLQALAFYRGEIIAVAENIIRDASLLLVNSPNTLQALGFANYIFINEIALFSKCEETVQKLNRSCSHVIQLMGETLKAFQVDLHVMQLVPHSLHILNIPFIRILKSDCGLALIRDIPSNYLTPFVKICALCSASDMATLKEYINSTRAVFLQKQEVIDQKALLTFMNGLAERLESRDMSWLGKTEKMKKMQLQVIAAHLEKGISLSEECIRNCLDGNNEELARVLQLPRAMEAFTSEVIEKLFDQFGAANSACQLVEAFNKQFKEEKLKTRKEVIALQEVLGFKLYPSQLLCLNYLLDNLSFNHMIHFGIGNGKTVLCVTLAILIACTQKKAVFIISKNEHLVQRDFKKFHQAIKAMGLNGNLNNCAKAAGLYFYTQPQLKKQSSQVKLQNVIEKATIIVDEYDWILFDGAVDSIVERLSLFKKAERVIGFSGSRLTDSESTCIQIAFETKPVTFPSLDRLKGDKKMQIADELITSNQGQFINRLKEIIEAQVNNAPVIVVAQENYSVIEQGLSKSAFDFVSLSRNQAAVIESVIDGRYLMRNAKKHFGVYLLNEAHGRGTDIQTNDEVNSNGGSYLIIADVFSERSEEQIIGRIGRLNTRGRWQRVLYKQGTLDSSEQLLMVEQRKIELQYDRKICQVQSNLEEQQEKLHMSTEEVENSIAAEKIEKEKIEQPQLKITNENDQDIAKTEEKKVESAIEDQKSDEIQSEVKEEISEENPEEEQSKLGFYQPSYLETIVDKLKENPLMKDNSHEQIQEHVRRVMKRNFDEISKSARSSRSPSKEKWTKRKRGRPKKVVGKDSDNEEEVE